MKITHTQFNELLDLIKTNKVNINVDWDVAEDYASFDKDDHDIEIPSETLGGDYGAITLRGDWKVYEYRQYTSGGWDNCPELICGDITTDIDIKEVLAFDCQTLELTEDQYNILNDVVSNSITITD